MTEQSQVPKIDRIYQPVEIELGTETWTGVVERIHWNHNRIVVSVDFLSLAEFEQRTREQAEALTEIEETP